jgi:rsbT co-antagonist protein RsbR
VSPGTSEASIPLAIETLERAIDAIRQGAVEQTVVVPFDSDHPIGALAEAVNDMAGALRKTLAARHANETELEVRLSMIESQRAAIAELSSPVIEVWQGVLTLPVIGPVDPERATAMTASLLEAVARVRADFVIVDVTGMHGVGPEVTDHLIRLVRCVGLLGSRCAISGMRPDVARGLVELGSDTSELKSFPTLRAALASHVVEKPKARPIAPKPKTEPRG